MSTKELKELNGPATVRKVVMDIGLGDVIASTQLTRGTVNVQITPFSVSDIRVAPIVCARADILRRPSPLDFCCGSNPIPLSLIAHIEDQHFAGLFLFLEVFDPHRTPASQGYLQLLAQAVRSWQIGS